MKERITVKSLVEEFSNKKIMNTKVSPDAVEKFIHSKLDFVAYLPFADKRELCENVLGASCTRNGGIIEVDSVSRYILFTLSMLAKYTNLEFESNDDEDAIDQYDMLCKCGLLNPILECIKSEYAACNDILNMMMSDIDANNNNIAAVLDKVLHGVLDKVNGFADILSKKVEGLNLDLSQINIEQYKGLLDLLTRK